MRRFRCRRAAKRAPADRPPKRAGFIAAGLRAAVASLAMARLAAYIWPSEPRAMSGAMTDDRRDHREFRAARPVGRPLSLCHRARPHAAAAAGERPQRRQQGAGLRQPGLAGHHVKPDGAAGPVLSFDGDSDAHIVRGLIAILFALYSGKRAQRDPGDRRARAVRQARLAREPHAAALERLALDGRAHPRRSQRGARRRRPEPHRRRPSKRRIVGQPGPHRRARAARCACAAHSRSAAPAGRARAAARPWPSAAASARSRSTSSRPLRKQQTSSSRPENSGPTASSAWRTRWRARDHRLGEVAGDAAAAAAGRTIGLAQFEVVRGIRCARVKSARSRSPACN